MTAEPGATFGGRYRVDRRLASGGMAIVYEGTDTLLRRRVAIKVLRDQYAVDDDFVRRFEYEAQAAARLSHPNIVAVYDFGRAEGSTFIVMELVEGPTLGELVSGEKTLPEAVAIDYALQIASGLAYAHRQGLLHRDIKPANILVTHDDVVKLSDFGIARAVSEHTLGVTQPGMVMGSVAYISPEQAQGRELDERSDLYALGVVLYQMLTGALPFSGDSPVAVALKHVGEAPPPIDDPNVSPALAAIVARLLEKDPAQRFASASDLATALRETREQPAQRAAAGGARSFGDAPTMTIPTVTAPQPPPRRSASPDRGATAPAGAAPESFTSVTTATASPSAPVRVIVVVVLLGLLAALAGYAAVRSPLFGPGKNVAVLDFSGTSATQAQQKIVAAGLQPRVHQEDSETVPTGRVIRQSPEPGTKLAAGDPVDLFVSDGPPSVDVPDIKGYTADDAQRTLRNAKFRVTLVKKFSDQPAGTVLAEAPAGGAKARIGSVVTLTVSQGVQPVTVPSLVSMSLDAARAEVKKLNLTLAVAQRVASDSIPADTVASQDPSAGASAHPGDTISVTVSTGAPPAQIPDVGGASPDEATATLRRAGFEVARTYNLEPANAPGTVTSQDPPPGTPSRKGTKVTIVINVPGTVPDVAGMTLDEAKRAIVSAGYAIGNVAITQDGDPGKVVRSEPEANANLRPGESVVLYYHQANP